jgi:hypothetical protein
MYSYKCCQLSFTIHSIINNAFIYQVLNVSTLTKKMMYTSLQENNVWLINSELDDT